MSERTGSGVWKAAALILAGGLSGNVFAMLTGLSRADVQEIVQEQAPYVKDKGRLELRLEGAEEDIRDLKSTFRSIETRQMELSGKIDSLLLALSSHMDIPGIGR